MLQRSLQLIGQAQGAESVKMAAPLGTLAAFYDARGSSERAEGLYARAIAIREKTLGPDHPSVAPLVGRLAALYRTRGDTARALEAWTRYGEIRERNLAHNLPIGSDRLKLDFLASFSRDLDDIVSFHAQAAPADPAAL